jgi:predicted aspartyl protease
LRQTFTRSFLVLTLGSWTLGASLAAASSNPAKDGDHASGRASLPVHIYGGFLAVVEGQFGESLQHQNFVVDTGTSHTILNLRVAQALSLTLSPAKVAALGQDSAMQAARWPELDLGPVTVTSASFLVADLSTVEHDLKLPIAGIVGLDVLGRTSFRLDYENSVLEFGEVSGTGIAVEFSGPENLPLATVNINGRAFRLLVDTGAERLVLFGNRPAEALVTTSNRSDRTGNGVAGEVAVRALSSLELAWGGEHFRKDAILISGRREPLFDGLMSVRALGFRALAFDAPRQVIYLEK